MIDVRELLTDPDFVAPIRIVRIVRGVDDRGRTTETETEDTIQGSVQPATPREREVLPEADRIKESLTIWTVAEVGEADRLFWQGTAYRVASIETWNPPNDGFRKILAVKEDVS